MNKQNSNYRASQLQSWLLWTLGAIFYMYEMILRVFPSVITNDLMQAFSINYTFLGILVSCYYYSYTLLQLPCGLLLDKFGPRFILTFSSLLCAIGTLCFANTNIILVAQIGRFLIGAGSACAFISCLQIASAVFPAKYFALLAGVTNLMGTFGATLGSTPIAVATNAIGWKSMSNFLAILGVLLAACIYLLFPKKLPQRYQQAHKTNENLTLNATPPSTEPTTLESQQPSLTKNSSDETKLKANEALTALKEVIQNKHIILAGLVAGFMYLPISAFSELWAVPFFVAKYNIDVESASLASVILFLGVAIGSILMALLAEKINSYVNTLKISSILTSCLFFILINFASTTKAGFLCVLLIGLSTGAQVLGFTCAKNNCKPGFEGTCLAFTNFIIMLIGAIFQSLLGSLLDFFWDGKIINGVNIYEVSCYDNAISTLPLCLLIAFLLSFAMKDRK